MNGSRCLSCGHDPQEKPAREMWEYEATVLRGDALALMNKMGNDGWELVCPIAKAQTPEGLCDVWLAKRRKTIIHALTH